MAKPRVAPLSIEEAQEAAAKVDIPPMAVAANLYRVFLRHPALAKQINATFGLLMQNGVIDPTVRELIIMRIGWQDKGVYEWTHHWRIAQQFGLDESTLLSVKDWENHDHWTHAQRAALKATDDILEAGAISADTWKECAGCFPTDEERLELVAIIGNWKMSSEIIKSLTIPLEEGVVAWPPDVTGPA